MDNLYNLGLQSTNILSTIKCNYNYTSVIERNLYRSYDLVFNDLVEIVQNAYELESLGRQKQVEEFYKEVNKVHWIINLLYNAFMDLQTQIENNCCINEALLQAIKDKYKIQCVLDEFNCSNNNVRLKLWSVYQTLFTTSDPNKLLNIRYTNITQTSITLVWVKIGSTPYTIELRDANNVLLNTYTTNNNSYTISGLIASTDYKIILKSNIDCYYEDMLEFKTDSFYIYVNLTGNGISNRYTPVRIFPVVVGNSFSLNFSANDTITILNTLLVNGIDETSNTINTQVYINKPHTGTYTINTLLNQNYTIDLEFLPYTGVWTNLYTCITI